MSKRKKNIIVAYLEFIFLLFLEKLLLLLPAGIAYKIAEICAEFVFFIDFKHRKRTIQHLLHAGLAANFAEAKKMAKENFLHYAGMAVDTLRFKKILHTKEDVLRNIEISGDKEAIEKFLSGTAQNSIIITAHYGNWEVAGFFASCITNKEITTPMRKLDNPFLEKLVVSKRLGYGVKLLDKQNALKPILKALANNQSVCFIADQHAGSQEGIEVKFFGQPARAHKSPVLIQNKTKVPIITAVCERIAPLKYKIRVSKPIYFDEKRSIEESVQLYTSQLEELIRENPLQWCWAHRRWLNINRKNPKERTNA